MCRPACGALAWSIRQTKRPPAPGADWRFFRGERILVALRRPTADAASLPPFRTVGKRRPVAAASHGRVTTMSSYAALRRASSYAKCPPRLSLNGYVFSICARHPCARSMRVFYVHVLMGFQKSPHCSIMQICYTVARAVDKSCRYVALWREQRLFKVK